MAKLSFSQFLSRYGIKMLVTSTPDIVPGAVIERRKRGYFKYGHLQQVLGGSDASWRCKLEPANFIYGTVERSLSLKARTTLHEFGVNIGGGLANAKSVTFYIENVQAKRLISRNKMSLIPKLFAYRDKNRKSWNRDLNDKWVADYTYYATEVRFSFETERGVNLRAEIADDVISSARGKISWTSKGSFVVTNTVDVPFGFSGWKL